MPLTKFTVRTHCRPVASHVRYALCKTAPIAQLSKRTAQSTCCRSGATQPGRACGCSLSEFGIRASEVVTAAAPWRFDCESNEKEQRPDRHVRKNSGSDLCRNPENSPTEWRPHRYTTITITICGSIPFIVLFFSSSLLIFHCPPRPTTIVSTLPTPSHTTTTTTTTTAAL